MSQLQLGSNLEKMDISYNSISSEHFKVFLLRNKECMKNLSHLAMAACGENNMTSETDKGVSYIYGLDQYSLTAPKWVHVSNTLEIDQL